MSSVEVPPSLRDVFTSPPTNHLVATSPPSNHLVVNKGQISFSPPQQQCMGVQPVLDISKSGPIKSPPPSNIDGAMIYLRREMTTLRQMDRQLLAQLLTLHRALQEVKRSLLYVPHSRKLPPVNEHHEYENLPPFKKAPPLPIYENVQRLPDRPRRSSRQSDDEYMVAGHVHRLPDDLAEELMSLPPAPAPPSDHQKAKGARHKNHSGRKSKQKSIHESGSQSERNSEGLEVAGSVRHSKGYADGSGLDGAKSKADEGSSKVRKRRSSKTDRSLVQVEGISKEKDRSKDKDRSKEKVRSKEKARSEEKDQSKELNQSKEKEKSEENDRSKEKKAKSKEKARSKDKTKSKQDTKSKALTRSMDDTRSRELGSVTEGRSLFDELRFRDVNQNSTRSDIKDKLKEGRTQGSGQRRCSAPVASVPKIQLGKNGRWSVDNGWSGTYETLQ